MVDIYCKNNNSTQSFPEGSSLLDIYNGFGLDMPYGVVSAKVNNKVEDLNFRVYYNKDVEFLDITNPSGMRTYFRSLCFILVKAVEELYPQGSISLEHPVSRGYYCDLHLDRSIGLDDVIRIKQKMQEIIAADIPFQRIECHTRQAAEMFLQHGMMDKAKLLRSYDQLYTFYYRLGNTTDCYYGSLVPSTGYIRLFDLEPYIDGALLRVPMQSDPTQLAPKVWQKKMYEVYKEHLTLQHALGLNNVGDLNLALKKGYASEVIMISEAMQEKQIARIADEIAEQYKKGVRMVLIAGPSSSGKTTTCKRLEIQLATNLLHPIGISLDDYFVNREDTPKDENGEYDFESLYALDLPYFNADLQRLIAGEEIDMPTFDFETGKRVYRGKKMKLQENSIIVIEGIHALNPELTANLDDSLKYRIYVSALTSISLDNHNWIPTTDNRLLRRIIRDYRFRGYSAEETILRWPSVRRGEDKWIFPYQEYADAMFNSAMLYELAALRAYAEPILANVQESSPANAEAYRLLRFLRYFNYIPQEDLPKTSLLREFVGGGSFQY